MPAYDFLSCITLQINKRRLWNHAVYRFPVIFGKCLSDGGSRYDLISLLLSGDFLQLDAAFVEHFFHCLIISKCCFICRFFPDKSDADVEGRSNPGCKNCCIQLCLGSEFIGALNEVCRECSIGNNIISAADDFYALHIPYALLEKGKSVGEWEYAPVFPDSKDDDFIAVVMSIFDKAPVA